MECARCGADVGNGGTDKAAVISTQTADGNVLIAYFGKACGCERRVLTKAALADLIDKHGPVELRRL